MEIIRDSDVVSGFRFEHPIADFPLLTHCGEAACNANHFIGPHRHSVLNSCTFFVAIYPFKSNEVEHLKWRRRIYLWRGRENFMVGQIASMEDFTSFGSASTLTGFRLRVESWRVRCASPTLIFCERATKPNRC